MKRNVTKQARVKKYIIGAVAGLLTVIVVVLFLLWNRYLNKNSLLTRFVAENGQEIYLLGTYHENHFNKWLNYSMEDMLCVVENVQPDVVFLEAREEYFEQYGVVDGPIDMSVVYSYCLEHDIPVEFVDWWVVDNNYQSGTTSDVRDDAIFGNIKGKLQSLWQNETVLVVCGGGHFYEQAKRFERAGFAEKKLSQKGSYFSSEGVTFAYPASTAEVWEKRAYFYAYTYPAIVGADDTLDESIKKQFTGGNHDAFYKQQLKYCDWFRGNILFEE